MAWQLLNYTHKGFTFPAAYARVEIPSIYRTKPNSFANIRLSIYADKDASDAGAEPLAGVTLVVNDPDFSTYFAVAGSGSTVTISLLAQSYAAIASRSEIATLLTGATSV